MNNELRDQLTALRGPLLALHKSLLEHERSQFEQNNQRAVSPGELVRLAMYDPWFAWLRQISEMIVRLDEQLEEDVFSLAAGTALVLEARQLFHPESRADADLSPNAREFRERYKSALQKDARSVLAHVDVQRALF